MIRITSKCTKTDNILIRKINNIIIEDIAKHVSNYLRVNKIVVTFE